MGNGYQTVWYTDPQRTQALDPSQTPALRLEGQTPYAAYQPIQYTVQFLPGGGNGTMEPQAFTYDQAQALKPNEFTKEHYTCAGWKMPNGKILTNGQQVENLTFKKDQVVTLTATWTERDYTGEAYAINLHANGGAGEDASLQGAVYGTAYTLPAHSFVKENHRFAGWALESGGQPVYGDETSVLIQHPQHLNGEALELYAVWEKQTYPVILINGSESQMQNVAHGDPIVFVQIPQKRGYAFDGWYTEEGGKWEAQDAWLQQAMATLNQGHYRFEVGSLMDISAIVWADSTVLGRLSELSAPVRFSIAVPTQMQRTGRIFKVLTMHDGQTFELPAHFENGIVAFETQRFSPFALVYGDPAESLAGSEGMRPDGSGVQTPLLGSNTLQGDTAVQTGDKAGMLVPLAGAILSAAAAAGLWILRKKTT